MFFLQKTICFISKEASLFTQLFFKVWQTKFPQQADLENNKMCLINKQKLKTTVTACEKHIPSLSGPAA